MTTKKPETTTSAKTKAYQTLIEKIDGMKITELNEFVKALQDHFGIDPANMVAAGGSQAGAQAEQKSTFNVILKEVGQSKIAVIKALSKLTGKGLLDAKKMLDTLPLVLKENQSEADAEALKKEFEETGAVLELK